MTAIITVICRDSVYSVSDRLVSVPSIRGDRSINPYIPYDSAANKSIVWVGTDCRLVLGYTGPSHIGEKCTDKWLAEVLRGGEEMPEQFESRWPPKVLLSSQDLLQLLSETLPGDLTVCVGGYQQTAYGDIPRLWVVERHSICNSHEETSAVVIPRNAATVATYKEIEVEVNASRPERYADGLVAAIRKISVRNSVVGSDVMTVELCRGQRRIKVGMHLSEDAEGKETLMYAPLFLFPGAAMSSMRLSPYRSRIAVGPGCGMASEGPLEDLEHDCEIILNVNRPPGNYLGFDEHVRSLPPWL